MHHCLLYWILNDCPGWIKQDPISIDTQRHVKEIQFYQTLFTHLYAHAILFDCTYDEHTLGLWFILSIWRCLIIIKYRRSTFSLLRFILIFPKQFSGVFSVSSSHLCSAEYSLQDHTTALAEAVSLTAAYLPILGCCCA